MIWNIVVGWLLVGLISVVWCLYVEYNPADDFTLEDLGMVVATICAGPIFAVWYIKESAGDIVLIKGKQKNDN